MAANVRQGAKKWLATLFGEGGAVTNVSGAKEGATKSKSIAKERLQIILAHQRGSQVLAGVNLEALQQELLQCVQRHIQVANGANINIAVKQEGQLDIFEMQVPVDAGHTGTTTGGSRRPR